MKHTTLSVLLCAVLLCGQMLSFPASAADTDEASEQTASADCISPAIRVLSARAAMKKNGPADQTISFCQDDFAAVLGYTPSEIVLTSLPDPTTGVLKLGGMTLAAGSRLSASVLDALCFVPTGTGTVSLPASASFTFTASGSAIETTVPRSCMLYLLSTPNDAPAAADRHVTTYEEIPVSASLSAADPEFDDLTYEIVREPKKGSVTLNAEDGTFVYTPSVGTRGQDVFSWRVSDRWGNQSEIVRTTLSVRRADDGLSYADLDGHPCAAAAMRLTEDGIFSGTSIGDVSFFSPDQSMTRGEFLVCAMRAAGYGELPGASLPMFANADDIPEYLSGYLAAAYNDGIVHGGVDALGNTVFNHSETISRAEAAVLLYRLFDIGTPTAVPVFSAEEEEALPAWSIGAYSSVCAAGIMTAENPDGIVSRALCAEMLSAAMDLNP